MNSAIANKRKNRGGRPEKPIKRNQQLAVMCTTLERKVIESKARAANVSNSEFLRTIAMEGQVGRKIKALPKEVLLFTAALNHLAANINQIAKKRNQNNPLSASEWEDLRVLVGSIKTLVIDIKKFLQ